MWGIADDKSTIQGNESVVVSSGGENSSSKYFLLISYETDSSSPVPPGWGREGKDSGFPFFVDKIFGTIFVVTILLLSRARGESPVLGIVIFFYFNSFLCWNLRLIFGEKERSCLLACDVEIKMRISFFKKRGSGQATASFMGREKRESGYGTFSGKKASGQTLKKAGILLAWKESSASLKNWDRNFFGPMPAKKEGIYQALKKTLSLFAGKNGGKRFQILVFLLLLFLTLGIIHLSG